MLGSISSSMVNAQLTRDGKSVDITVNFHDGGELTNPMHCLAQYCTHNPDGTYTMHVDETHPMYRRCHLINRHENELLRVHPKVLTIQLPFECKSAGFIDPILGGQQAEYDFDVFPLPAGHLQIPNAPVPTTKFLHVVCEEKNSPLIMQAPVSRPRYLPPNRVAGPTAPVTAWAAPAAWAAPLAARAAPPASRAAPPAARPAQRRRREEDEEPMAVDPDAGGNHAAGQRPATRGHAIVPR